MNDEKGFTLLELLIVIAIIAVLVLVVLVAMDPVRRINDSYDRMAQSNVRATGTLISVCVAQRLSQMPPLTYEECADDATISAFGNRPSTVLLAAGTLPGDNDVCAAQQGSKGLTGHYYVYKNSVGTAEEGNGNLPAGWCP